jgi:hypothetical protein
MLGRCTSLFCRKPIPRTQAEEDENKMRRIDVNDPVAIRESGTKCYYEGDFVTAFECTHLSNI